MPDYASQDDALDAALQEMASQISTASAALGKAQAQYATVISGVTDLRDQRDNPPQDKVTPYWGCRAKDQASPTSAQLREAFERWDALIGPLKMSREFEQTLSGKPYDTSVLPEGAIHWPSIKDYTVATLKTWIATVPQGSPVTWHHEPEADMTASAFKTKFDQFYRDVKAIRPDILVAYTAGAYQYRKGKVAADGSYFPAKADIYSVDTYRKGIDDNFNGIKPLPAVEEFATWFKYADQRRQDDPNALLAISEWGRGRINDNPNPNANAQRAAVIPEDRQWLEDNGFWAWLPWLTDHGPGENWVPTDQPSIDALAAVGEAWA